MPNHASIQGFSYNFICRHWELFDIIWCLKRYWSASCSLHYAYKLKPIKLNDRIVHNNYQRSRKHRETDLRLLSFPCSISFDWNVNSFLPYKPVSRLPIRSSSFDVLPLIASVSCYTVTIQKYNLQTQLAGSYTCKLCVQIIRRSLNRSPSRLYKSYGLFDMQICYQLGHVGAIVLPASYHVNNIYQLVYLTS